MSSYYYPYFSARNVQPSSIQHYQQSICSLNRERQLFENELTQRKLRQKQQMLNYDKIKEYELQLRIKRRLNDLKNNAQRNDFQSIKPQYAEIQQNRNIQYGKQIEGIKAQRKYIQKNEQKQNNQNNINNKFESQKQKQKYNEKKIKQYQNQLLKKINQIKIDKEKGDWIRKQKNVVKGQEEEGRNYGIIINKMTQNISKNSNTDNKTKGKKHKSILMNNEGNKNKGVNKNADDFRKQLLSNYETLQCPRQSRQRGQMIDFHNQTINEKLKSKTKRSSINEQTKFHSQIRTKNKSKLSFNTKPQVLITLNPKSLSLKRIQNRIKLSMIVFKDSKMRNKRYQINHIINKFQTQNKLRKQIKDKINNNEKILRKHHLVVQSRTRI